MVGEIAMQSYVAPAILAGAIVLASVVAGDAAAPSKPAFTIDNGPVHDTVVDTMQGLACTGTIVPLYWEIEATKTAQALFYQILDGTKWVKFYEGGFGPETLRVTELGMSAQWNGHNDPAWRKKYGAYNHFDVWPTGGPGDTHLSGQTVTPYGTIELICKLEPTWWGSSGVPAK